jgi:hypothetical protein
MTSRDLQSLTHFVNIEADTLCAIFFAASLMQI